jgi:hypothetical protein
MMHLVFCTDTLLRREKHPLTARDEDRLVVDLGNHGTIKRYGGVEYW